MKGIVLNAKWESREMVLCLSLERQKSGDRLTLRVCSIGVRETFHTQLPLPLHCKLKCPCVTGIFLFVRYGPVHPGRAWFTPVPVH